MQQKIETLDGKQIEIMLISRRRQARGGVRFIQRGIDEQGNVANMVESEVILTHKELIYSFVQIRGSIPLFWEQKQKGLKTVISVKRSLALTERLYLIHMNDIISRYKQITMVNLVSAQKADEHLLSVNLNK